MPKPTKNKEKVSNIQTSDTIQINFIYFPYHYNYEVKQTDRLKLQIEKH